MNAKSFVAVVFAILFPILAGGFEAEAQLPDAAVKADDYDENMEALDRDDVFHRGAEYEKATLDEFRLVPDLKAFCWTNWTYAKEVPAGNDTLYGEERFYIVDVGRRVLALVYRNYLGELHPVGGKVLGIEWKRPAAGSPEEALMRRIEGLFSQAG